MPYDHCKSVSPSTLHRVLECPGSYLLTKDMPDKESKYAEVGTEAHTLCEYKLNRFLGVACEDPRPKLKHYDQKMDDNTDIYVETVLETYRKLQSEGLKPYLFVETRVDIPWVRECFGTADAIIVGGNTIYVFDYKNGSGVSVSAEWNPQMMAYALGAYDRFCLLFDIHYVSMRIVQPNLSSISSFSVPIPDLLEWADTVLTPTTNLAIEGKGGFKAGDWCRFCKAKATCRKRAEVRLEEARMEFENVHLLSNAELSTIYGMLDGIEKWAKDVAEYVEEKALEGESFPGYKLVYGRSNRMYSDKYKVAEAVKAAGYNPYKDPEVLGVTAMTELLGKKGFEDILGKLVVKPLGKLTLVPESDKREAVEIKPSVDDDFDIVKEA